MVAVNYDWDELEDNFVEEYDDAGAAVVEYTSEPELYGNLLSQNRQDVERQYHFDAEGSTLALTDGVQQVSDTYAYTAFGEVTENAGASDNPLQYWGRKEVYRTSVNLDYIVRAVQWSANLGRWLTSVAVGHGLHVVNPYGLSDDGKTELGFGGPFSALSRDRVTTPVRSSLLALAPAEQDELHWYYLFRKFLEALELRERARLLLAMGPVLCSRLRFSISRPVVVLEMFKHGDCAPTVFIRHVPLLIKELVPDRFFDMVSCPPQCVCVPTRFNTVRASMVLPFGYRFWFKTELPARIVFSDREVEGYRGPCTVFVVVLIDAMLEHQWGDCALGPPPVMPRDPPPRP